MTEKILARYPCTQGELYSACDTAWGSCLSKIGEFGSKNPFYTSAYVTAAISKIRAAELLPDVFQRNDIPESLRLELEEAADNARRFWQQLKLYIGRAYKGEIEKVKLNAAGFSYYTDSGNDDWDSVRSLMIDGNEFITTYETELKAGGNMPPTFVAEFNSAKENFFAIQGLYLKAGSDSQEQTQDKIIALNEVFDDMREMLKDGQFIFAKNPAVKKQFVFESILELVSSPGGAGLRGMMLNGNTSGPLANVTLSLFEGTNILVEARYTTISLEDGGYDFGVIASGSYTLKMECEGFVTKTEVVEVQVGVKSSKSFTLLVVS